MILTLTLAIATLGSKHVVAGETVLHDYYYYYGANPDTPAENDHLTVTVQKHAVIISSPIPFTHGGTQYTLYAYGYAAAEASPIVHNVNETKYRATAWCETTGDQGTLGIPSRDNIDQEKYQNDGDGGHNGDEYRWYSMDNTTEAGVAYKHHTVVSKHDNPWWPGDSSTERYLFLSQTSYKIDMQDHTPTGLDANPYAKGEIDSTSFSYTSTSMENKAASTLRCTDPAHAPGTCPGP